MDKNLNKFNRIKFLLEELYRIIKEGDSYHPFLRFFEGMLAIILDENYSIEDRLQQLKSEYSGLPSGMGGVGDSGIWCKDEEKSDKLTIYYHQILDELWELLECGISHLPSVDEGYPPGHIYWTLVNKEESKKTPFKSLQEFIIRIFRRS